MLHEDPVDWSQYVLLLGVTQTHIFHQSIKVHSLKFKLTASEVGTHIAVFCLLITTVTE